MKIRRCSRIRKFENVHPAYLVWKAMMTNCGLRKRVLPERTRKLYEGRGVTVCDEWRDLSVFEEWLLATGWKPKSGLVLTRKDKFKNFCPENCVVVNRTESANLRSNVVRIGGKSVRDILGDVPDGRSTYLQKIRQRIHNYRWPMQEALNRGTTPHNMITKLHLKNTLPKSPADVI